MIRHVVMWAFKDNTEQEQQRFLSGLEALYGVIPEIKASTVARNCNPNEKYDAVLIADFDSMDALSRYANDPRHLSVAAICKDIRKDRVAVDFEI
jgi:hypothetical protein